MSYELGSDIIEVQRIQESITRHGKRFLDRIFTPLEQAYCDKHRDAMRHYAGRFAAKEAVVKALGTGISEAISWLDIEVNNDLSGKPLVLLSDRAIAHFGKVTIKLTISHCKEYALAVAIAQMDK